MHTFKKYTLILAAACSFAACSTHDDSNLENKDVLADTPATQVYMGIDAINDLQMINASTRAVESLSPIVKISYFNVKVDPRLGYTIAPNKYATLVPNGKAYTDCPFITINKGNDNSYFLSSDGSAMKTLIAAGDTATSQVIKRLSNYYSRTNPISSTVVEDKIHVVWYLAKDMNNGWHIDGLLTDKEDLKSACEACRAEGFGEITFGENGAQLTYEQFMDYFPVDYRIKPLDKTLIADIHQQQHNTWGEIKTSLHIKEAKDVSVFIPVGSAYTLGNVEANVRARYFEKYFQIDEYEKAVGSKIAVKVEDKNEGIEITVTGVTDELVKALERRYNDGLTIEIHSFYKLAGNNGVDNFTAPVWEALKKSVVIYEGNKNVSISSAYYQE